MDSEVELKLQKQIRNLQAQVNALGAELRRLYRVTTHPSTRGFIEKLALSKSDTIDHGSLGGLSDDDHLQYIKHSLATAANDFLVASGVGVFVKNTLAEVKTILGLGSAAYTPSTDYAIAAKGVTNGDSHDHDGGDGAQIDHGGLSGLADNDHTQYVLHSLATAASDFLVASGAGAFIKKTLAEVKTLIGITDTATIDPGHKHSAIWASDGDPSAVSVDASGNVTCGAGNVRVSSGATAVNQIEGAKTSGELAIYAGTDWTNGSAIGLYGNSFTDREGALYFLTGYGGGSGKGVVFESNDDGSIHTNLVIKHNGNVGFGGVVTFGTSAAKVIGMAPGTTPTTAPENIIQLWAEDITGINGYLGLHKMTETTAQKEVVPGVIIKTDTGSPSNPYEGLMEINTFDNKVRMYADGGWRELGTW